MNSQDTRSSFTTGRLSRPGGVRRDARESLRSLLSGGTPVFLSCSRPVTPAAIP